MAKVKPKSLLPLISGKKTQMFDGLDDEDDFGFNSDDFTPKKNIKKLVIKNSGSASKVISKIQDKNIINNNNDSLLQSPSLNESGMLRRGKVDENPFVELFDQSVSLDKNLELSSITVDSCPDEAQDSLSKPDGESEGPPAPPPHPANIVLTRPGYYTLPSLEELADFVDENGNCFVKDFTIGREGYGSVFFPGMTNITGMNFDEIVHFRKKEVTVYPDDLKKPEIGLGLNKKAEITLDCVWPIDKTSRSPIKSSERLKMMRYEEKLENTTLRIGGTFLDYRPETGSWVFEVKHFSKYGLKDDSDEEEINANESKLKSVQQQNLSVQKQIPSVTPPGMPGNDLTKEHGSDQKQPETTNGEDNLKSSAETIETRDELAAEDDAEMPDIFSTDYSADEALYVSESKNDKSSELFSHSLAVGLGVSSSNMQTMKASLFLTETDEPLGKDVEDRMETSHNEGHMLKLLNKTARKSSLSISGKSVKHCRLTKDVSLGIHKSPLPRPQSDVIQILRFQPVNTYPKVVGMRIKQPIPVIKESCMYKMRSLVDASFFMGHSFRVGWGPTWTFVHSGMPVGNATDPAQEKFSILTGMEKKVSVNTDWKVNLEKLNVSEFLTSKNPVVINQHKWMLENQLDHSSCVTENECPYFSPVSGTESLNIYAAMAEQDEENMSSLPDYEQVHHMRRCWDICVALWGNPIEFPSQVNDKTSYEYHQMRREAISRWISETEANAINSEIESNSFQKDGHLKSIMSYLSGRQVTEACASAQKAGDNYLSMLLAQAGGVNKSCKQLIEQQLDNFNTYGVGEFISHERLKILSLLAGKMVLKIGNQTINVCEGMNWRRALGLHLWYQCEPTSLIVEAVQMYDEAQIGNNIHGKYAKPPVPVYLEDDTNDLDEHSKIYDTCYHLLKLYANDAHSLEQTLSPTTSTVNHLDYRLSWHLSEVLESLGYRHLSLYQKECIHVSFAAQLESIGIWEWAIFVLAHLEDSKRREAAIKDCLGRHIRISSNEEYLSREQFIINRLGIPPKWVHHAKAIKAGYQIMPPEEAWHLLKSHNWNKAHKVILRHLAADAIINENHNYLEKYLLELAPAERNSKILDWTTGGAVYLNYINLCKTLQELKKQEATISQLEKLWPEVTSLCSKINHLSSCNPKDRLCQSEMSKNAANILRTLLMLKAQNDVNTEITSILAPHICNLEMPDDYMAQEILISPFSPNFSLLTISFFFFLSIYLSIYLCYLTLLLTKNEPSHLFLQPFFLSLSHTQTHKRTHSLVFILL
ncbi:NUP98 [Acanthosepion pharaonis]|uniref:Nuclear pore complex protein Nup98-Nup96 n=1 Tax=Acanthosepion pharaonis TaxID=158019 RepID=A0A812D2I8_ACAPH|nr:NUP98 [Sepia pharaonis]